MEGKDDSISICSSPSPIIPDSLFGTTNVTSSWYNNNNNNGGIAHIPHSDGLGFIPEENALGVFHNFWRGFFAPKFLSSTLMNNGQEYSKMSMGST